MESPIAMLPPSLSGIPLMAIGTAIALLLYNMSLDLGDLATVCPAGLPSVTGLHNLDFFVCFASQTYLKAVGTPEGKFAMFSTLLAGAPLVFFMGIEAGRQGVNGLIRYPVIFMTLAHLMGLGLVANLFYIPAFLHSQSELLLATVKGTNVDFQTLEPATAEEVQPAPYQDIQVPAREAAGPGVGGPVPLARNATGGYFRGVSADYARFMMGFIFSVVLVITGMANCVPSSPAFPFLNLLFLLSPIALTLLNLLPLPPSPAVHIMPVKNSRIVRMGYILIAGYSMAVYYTTAFQMLANVGILNPPAGATLFSWLSSIPGNLFKLDFSSGPIRYLLSEMLGMWLASFFILLRENYSIEQLVMFLGRSIVFSPGAATAYYFHDREDKISGLGDQYTAIKQHAA